MKLLFLLKKWSKVILSKAFTNYLGKRSSAILVEIPPYSYLIPISDLSFARSLNKNAGYNKPLIEFLLTHVSNQSNVLFVGTHIGSVLIPIAKKNEASDGD